MEHIVKSRLLSRKVNVHVVGAGGTGSHVVQSLTQLHHALIALGHPGGLDVTLIDDDIVTASNIGRQCFFESDLGHPKAEILINRANICWGTNWEASINKVGEVGLGSADIVIGCVDNRLARKNIIKVYSGSYYLDFGNRKNDGQVVLGQIEDWSNKYDRLPHIGDLFPEAIDPKRESDDDTPSCSLAEALQKQSLFINKTLATLGINLLTKMFTQGVLKTHGMFVNLETDRTAPLPVDPAAWERLGFKPKKKRGGAKK